MIDNDDFATISYCQCKLPAAFATTLQRFHGGLIAILKHMFTVKWLSNRTNFSGH